MQIMNIVIFIPGHDLTSEEFPLHPLPPLSIGSTVQFLFLSPVLFTFVLSFFGSQPSNGPQSRHSGSVTKLSIKEMRDNFFH